MALKTVGEIRAEATAIAVKVGIAAAVVVAAFLVWTQSIRGDGVSMTLYVVAVVAVVAAILLIRAHRDGWSFIANGIAIIATFAGCSGRSTRT